MFFSIVAGQERIPLLSLASYFLSWNRAETIGSCFDIPMSYDIEYQTFH